jgi:peptidoglycan-N-acetylmuramic acid deacetylase
MKRKDKLLALCLCARAFLMLLWMPIQAESASYQWYCRHVKDHEQPTAGAEFDFIRELGGYYIDFNHQSPEDTDKVIYLTFDAGYENGNVAKTLDVLKEESVTGAFFILGNLIRHDPALVKRMANEGHTVCNHTVRHKNMSDASDEAFLSELLELEGLYRDLTGQEMSRYYRPPEGKFSRKNLECAYSNGFQTIFWSFAYPDWDNEKQMPTEKAMRIVTENFHNGEVMLLHPTSKVNAEILGDVIREAKRQGYRFGTLDELTGAMHEGAR